MTTTDPKVVVYSVGPLSLSACAPMEMSPSDVTAAVNNLNRAGTEGGWTIADEPTFRQGGPNPGPCEQDALRTHYLFHC